MVAVPFTAVFRGLNMDTFKWIIGIGLMGLVVIMIANTPVAKNVPQQSTDSQPSFTPPDKDGRSQYVAPEKKSSREKWERTAASCWGEYERKSLSPYEKRQIAAFCEGLDERARSEK
jgi:hypothetical protein